MKKKLNRQKPSQYIPCKVMKKNRIIKKHVVQFLNDLYKIFYKIFLFIKRNYTLIG